MKDEGAVKDFLAIRFKCDTNSGQILLTQPGLINSILADLGLVGDEIAHKFTPANDILHSDPDVAIREESWNYHSVIGKMNFVTKTLYIPKTQCLVSEEGDHEDTHPVYFGMLNYMKTALITISVEMLSCLDPDKNEGYRVNSCILCH